MTHIPVKNIKSAKWTTWPQKENINPKEKGLHLENEL